MGEIPNDVMKAAEAEYDSSDMHLGPNQTRAAIKALANAILAERQRCADVAQKEGDGYKEAGLPQSAMGAYTTRRAILGI